MVAADDANATQRGAGGKPARFKREAAILLILLGAVTLIRLPRLGGPIDITWDGSVYYVLGTSLAEGKGYRLLNEPGEIEAIQYPPLLPMIVAAHQWLLGTNDFLIVGPWLRFFYFFLSACLAIATYFLVRQCLPPKFALPTALASTLYFFVYYWADTLYAEIPFSLATVLFFLCNRKSDRAAYAVAAGVMAAAAYLLRASGIALLVAWVAESLLRKRYRQALLRAGMALVPIVLWQAHTARVQGSEQYRRPVYEYQRAPYQYSNVTYAENTSLIDPFKPELGRAGAVELLRRVGSNLKVLPQALGEPVTAPTSFWQAQLETFLSRLGSKWDPQWRVAIPIILMGYLVIGGMVLLWIRGERLIPLYFSAYAPMICLTPWPEQFGRYLTPLAPFLALSLFNVLAWVGREDSPWRGRTSLALTVMLLVVVFFTQGLTLTQSFVGGHRLATYYDASGTEIRHRQLYYDPRWEPVNAALEWLRRRARPGEVVAATAPHAAYLRTGLKAVLPPLEADSELAARLLDSAMVNYVVLDFLRYPGISERYAAPAVEKHPQLWKLIYSAPDGGARIYERIQ